MVRRYQSHTIVHDFTACEIINVTIKYTIKMMEGLCDIRLKKQGCLSILVVEQKFQDKSETLACMFVIGRQW